MSMEVTDLVNRIEDTHGVTLDLYDKGNRMILSRIIVPKSERGAKVGSRVMQEIIDYADSNELAVYLTPSKDFGASSLARLKRFYKSFGFKDKPRSDFSEKETMVRYPDSI